MKAKVYLETTVVSYLTARKPRDLIAAAHQTVTRRWWRRRRRFDLYGSQVVIREAGAGDAEAAKRRLAALKAVPLLEVNDTVKELAAAIAKAAALPKKATEDALHIALATDGRMKPCGRIRSSKRCDASANVTRRGTGTI